MLSFLLDSLFSHFNPFINSLSLIFGMKYGWLIPSCSPHFHVDLFLFLWPDTMMKFASFETIVEQLYKHVIPMPKDQCSNTLQLSVSFTGGYLAGILCAVVSHPADNLVSFLNNAKGATTSDVSNNPHFFYYM